MAFCANCGKAVPSGAAFCEGCGKPVASQAASQPAWAGAQVAGSAPVAVQSVPALQSNVAAALSYILGFITGIIFLALEPYKRDRFVRFHAIQSILYSAAGIVFRVAWHILVGALSDVTGWAVVLLVPVGLVISLGLFIFWIFLMYQAYSGREFRIPVIGAIAAKQVG